MSDDIEVKPEDFVLREAAGKKWEVLTGDGDSLGVFRDGPGALTIVAQGMVENGAVTELWIEHSDGSVEAMPDFDPQRFLRGGNAGSSRSARRRAASRPVPTAGVRRRRRRGLDTNNLRRTSARAREATSGLGEALGALLRDMEETV